MLYYLKPLRHVSSCFIVRFFDVIRMDLSDERMEERSSSTDAIFKITLEISTHFI